MHGRELLATPELDSQWGDDHVLVWARQRSGPHRRGWVIELDRPCRQSACGCSRIDVVVHEVDDRLVAIVREGRQLAFSWRDESRVTAATYEASIDLLSGRVAAPSRHEIRRPDALACTSADELSAALPGAVLEELWSRLQRSKGRKVEALAKRPPRSWEFGRLLDWSEIARHAREDLYELEVGRVRISALFCPVPTCDCRETIVQISPYDAVGLRDEAGRGPAGHVHLHFDDRAPRVEAEDGYVPEHVLAAWNAYLARWPDYRPRLEDQYAKIRRALAGSIHTPLPDPSEAQSEDGEAVAIAPLAGAGVGRNEPCPCGSGRKYKRCCLREHERA